MTIGVFLPEGTEAEVCADIARRQQMGINKYGTTVAENRLSLREWLVHAYEETRDNKHEIVLSMFKEGEAITPKDIAKAAGLTPMQVRNALQKLKDKGRVTWEEGGLYRLAKVVQAEAAMPLVARAVKNAHPLHTIWMNCPKGPT